MVVLAGDGLLRARQPFSKRQHAAARRATAAPGCGRMDLLRPASASTAYTHFTEIELGDGVELTIEDGDALVIDVLGLDPT